MKPFDTTGAFQDSVQKGELRQRAVRSAGVTVLSQAAVFAVQIIGTIVLARLLMPADFGVVAMVTTFSLLIMSFGINGYTEAILQREKIDHFLASNLFWINFGVAFLLAGSFAAAGPLLAGFYHDVRVSYVAVALSSTVFLSGISVVHLALLKRALRFSVTSANDVFSGAVSVVLSMLLAWRGWGYWALVAGAVARSLVQCAGAWYLCRWIPGRPRRVAGTASVVRFALNVFGRFTLNYSTRNTDNLLVGWYFGPASLGFYKKAYDLFLLPANQLFDPVFHVVLSSLGRLERGSARYKRYFLNGLSILAFVGMGMGAILTLTGNDLIFVLLGAKWKAAGQIFTFFGPGIGIMLIYCTHGLLHLSIGRADRWFRWVVVEFLVTVLLFLLGVRYGPRGVAAAWTASFWILTIPAFWYAGRPIQLRATAVINSVWRYVMASLLSAYVAMVLIGKIHPLAVPGTLAALERIATTVLLFLGLYIVAVIFFHGSTEPLNRFAGLLPDLVPWARFRDRSSPLEDSIQNDPPDLATVSESGRPCPEEV